MAPNIVRRPGGGLDDTDRRILAVLADDGRIPNNALAERVGVAASTCLVRLRELRRRGVLRGVHARVDLAAAGRPIQAMIAVRLRAHVREQVEAFRATAPSLPGVVAMYHLSGKDDYLLHVALPDPDALRDFVLQHMTGHPAVGHTETSLVFEEVRGDAAALLDAPGQTSTSPSSRGSGRSRAADRPSR